VYFIWILLEELENLDLKDFYSNVFIVNTDFDFNREIRFNWLLLFYRF